MAALGHNRLWINALDMLAIRRSSDKDTLTTVKHSLAAGVAVTCPKCSETFNCYATPASLNAAEKVLVGIYGETVQGIWSTRRRRRRYDALIREFPAPGPETIDQVAGFRLLARLCGLPEFVRRSRLFHFCLSKRGISEFLGIPSASGASVADEVFICLTNCVEMMLRLLAQSLVCRVACIRMPLPGKRHSSRL